MEKATREEEIHKARHEKEVWVNQGRQGRNPNQWYVGIQVPAIQVEQVEDDVALVTAEYVPAKAMKSTGNSKARYFEESDPKPELFFEKEQRWRREGEGERESPMNLLM
jgi:hypothetical protein